MTNMNCSNVDKYITKTRKCCDRCPAGKYVKTECDDKKATECVECAQGYFTATSNSVHQCHPCSACSSDNKLRNLKNCTSKENTVCECNPGFFCTNDACDHCQPVKTCSLGEGVKVPATRSNDTVCVTCKDGTYSNVTDYLSPCKPHTRCQDLGRVLKTSGTPEADAICGDFSNSCPWIIPAALWAGFVFTALVLLAVVIYWRAKSYRAGSCRVSTTPVKMDAASLDLSLPATSLNMPLPSTELNGHYRERCTMKEFKLPLFTQDDNPLSCSIDSSLPITPLKVSVSFAESSYIKNITGNFLRTHSEPQEDEWCGT